MDARFLSILVEAARDGSFEQDFVFGGGVFGSIYLPGCMVRARARDVHCL